MKNINIIHEEVFTLLSNWSENERTSRIEKSIKEKTEINPYFYMRSIRDERFKNGYWFPGNDSYMCISFWSGGDSMNKTPNIYFEISEKAGCRVVITAKDSEAKSEYFLKMVNQINIKENIQFENGKNTRIWIKHLNSPFTNWKNDLIEFITNEKRIIDNFITKNAFIETEEFISSFGMINPADFEKMLSRVLKERDIIQEYKYLNDYIRSQNLLPLSLLSLSVENFQGIRMASVSELRADSRWIFITGENGYGKTTILQSIALSLTNENTLDSYINDDSRIALEISHNKQKFFPVKTKNSSIGTTIPVIGYGPARLNIQSRSSENHEDKSSNPILSLFDNETLLKNINYELFATNYADKKTFRELEDIIKTVSSGRITSIKVEKMEVLFFEKLNNGDILEALPLSKLAAGFRSIINIVIDIYLRFRDYHSGKRYRDFYGIVLIDEIENHLHPALQRELPMTLTKVFPKIQFIVSTHSPIPLLAAEKNSIILRVNRNKNDGISIERLDENIDFPNLLPNTILTSPIFGFENIFPENKDSSDFIRSENTYSEVIRNNEQKIKINNHLSAETTAEILKLLKKE